MREFLIAVVLVVSLLILLAGFVTAAKLVNDGFATKSKHAMAEAKELAWLEANCTYLGNRIENAWKVDRYSCHDGTTREVYR